MFGRYNYGNPDRGESPEYAFFLPALKNLGHEVRHFETWQRHSYSDLGKLNKALLDAVDTYKPDLLFSVQMNYEIWIETIELIRARGDVITLSWATDDSWKYREVSRFVGPSYDAVITTCDYVVDSYKQDGTKAVILSQWAATSSKLRAPVPASDCRHSVSFVGTSHGSRARTIQRLKARGIEVDCFGYGWPNGPVDIDTANRIIRSSVISLNFANSRGENQIKARTFEVPGCGGFLMTESARSLENFYIPGKEIIVYDGLEDLEKNITYYLSNKDERDEIARAGFERTVREHTYEQRFSKILDRLQCGNRSLKVVHPQISTGLDKLLEKHAITPVLTHLRNMLVCAGVTIYGPIRGPRAARRLVYELSWRLQGRNAYSATGWPGRMFPHD